MFSPLIFFLYTNDCIFRVPTAKVLKFADDETDIDLIQDHDEFADRSDIEQLAL